MWWQRLEDYAVAISFPLTIIRRCLRGLQGSIFPSFIYNRARGNATTLLPQFATFGQWYYSHQTTEIGQLSQATVVKCRLPHNTRMAYPSILDERRMPILRSPDHSYVADAIPLLLFQNCQTPNAVFVSLTNKHKTSSSLSCLAR